VLIVGERTSKEVEVTSKELEVGCTGADISIVVVSSCVEDAGSDVANDVVGSWVVVVLELPDTIAPAGIGAIPAAKRKIIPMPEL